MDTNSDRTDRPRKLNRHELISEISKRQNRLWLVCQALNLPEDDRLLLDKNWMSSGLQELALIATHVETEYTKRKLELEAMETKYGKADDIRKVIEGLHVEYSGLCRDLKVNNAFFFPKGFRYMNSHELQDVLARARQQIDQMRLLAIDRAAEAKRKQAEAEVRATHERELKRQHEAREAVRLARVAELQGIIAPYTELMTKLLAHPVLNAASVKLPKLNIDLRTELMLGSLGDEGYALLLKRARDDIASATRKLREPLRRAHQSAYSRGITKLTFEEYLRKEGFGSVIS